jgi:hypothetical protein
MSTSWWTPIDNECKEIWTETDRCIPTTIAKLKALLESDEQLRNKITQYYT